MCIVISGESQPDTTKLINVPVCMNNKKYNFFMYINNFSIRANERQNTDMGRFSLLTENNNFSILNNDNFFGNFDNGLSFEDRENQRNSIMVVPIAVDPHTPTNQIGLVDISTKQMKQLKQNILNMKPSTDVTLGLVSENSFSAKLIEVHRVGNYDISIATSMNRLMNNIDWTKFKKPSDFNKRMSTFYNKELYPRNMLIFI